MMVLNKLPGRTEYYLPSYFMNFKAATDPMVKEVEKLADMDSWPWGKSQSGLQLACMVISAYELGGEAGKDASVYACLAVRNVSDKPLAVNLYDDDKCLQITATSDAGTFSTDFYNFKSRQPTEFDADNTVVVKPGGIIFIGPTGPADHGLGFQMPLRLGSMTSTPPTPRLAKAKGKTAWRSGKARSTPSRYPRRSTSPGRAKHSQKCLMSNFE